MVGGLQGRRLWGALTVLILIASPVFATHEADHRFIVHGTVRDDHGNPVADAKVIVVDPRVDQGMTAFTDRNGGYEALLHLHDTDLGDEIIVTALEQRKTVRAEFDPGDKVTVRKARVDFGAPGSGRPGSGWDNPRMLGGAGLIVGAAALFFLFRRFRRRKKSPSMKSRKKKQAS
ncbi:MAG: carboxypeptidase regulatory-like domain-containing protein [Nitrospirae bacterium]|nr:carboxypeptidase regulatory-like domain-containing protein [Nitrospirota bacterium]